MASPGGKDFTRAIQDAFREGFDLLQRIFQSGPSGASREAPPATASASAKDDEGKGLASGLKTLGGELAGAGLGMLASPIMQGISNMAGQAGTMLDQSIFGPLGGKNASTVFQGYAEQLEKTEQSSGAGGGILAQAAGALAEAAKRLNDAAAKSDAKASAAEATVSFARDAAMGGQPLNSEQTLAFFRVLEKAFSQANEGANAAKVALSAAAANK